MAPKASAATPPFGKDERVLCFHHDMLYEAKVLDSRTTEENSWQYKIHYKGWKNTIFNTLFEITLATTVSHIEIIVCGWDDWVPQDRVRKFTDENKELAAQLHNQMKALTRQPKQARGGAKGGKPNGSEMGSGRGSEERNTSFAANSRRGGRQKDYETEAVENSVSIGNSTHVPDKSATSTSPTPVLRKSTRVRVPKNHGDVDISEIKMSHSVRKRKIAAKKKGSNSSAQGSAVMPQSISSASTRSKAVNAPIFKTIHYGSDPTLVSMHSPTHFMEKNGDGSQNQASTVFTADKKAGATPGYFQLASLESDVQPTSMSSHSNLPSESSSKIVKRPVSTRSTHTSSSPTNLQTEQAPISTSNIVNEEGAMPAGQQTLQRLKLPRVLSGDKRATRNTAPGALPPWADSKSDQFDIIRWLKAEEYHPADPLLQRPPANYSYIDTSGRLKNPHKYTRSAPSQPTAPEHPKLAQHRKSGTLTPQVYTYYKDLPKNRNLPIAGIAPPDRRLSANKVSTSRTETPAIPHFPGLQTRAAETPALESDAIQPVAFLTSSCLDTSDNILEKSELTDVEQEEHFYARPSIKIPMPDHIKAILVDDWENVTKSQLLVPLPAKKSVDNILNDYLASEKSKRLDGTASMDILEEVISGLKEYFERCLGRILLYRFERNQYIEVRDGWAKKTGELAGKNATSTYGAEHFCRLLVSLPELIAQTNMDQQSVNRLREELQKLTNWLGKENHMQVYFVSEYEAPGTSYVEKAKTL